MMRITKLDEYDYTLLPGVIRVGLSSMADPSIVDIFSEIDGSDDLVYVEERYYNFTGEYAIFKSEREDKVFLDLNVVEILEVDLPDIMIIGDELIVKE